MKSGRIELLVVLVISVLVVSSAVLGAQDSTHDALQATQEVTAEATTAVYFSDGRVNSSIILGEFGIYCQDAQGEVAASYDGGRIAIYGANDEEYLLIPEEALRQLSDTAEAAAEAAMVTATPDMISTPTQPAILLGQTYATSGLIQFFLIGDNYFQLNGFLPDGKSFSYFWQGCTGSLDLRTAEGTQVFITTTPVATLPAPTPTLEMTAEVTTSP